MPPRSEFVCGLVLAAGGSSRLGRPKQLLPYGNATLLEHVLTTAGACSFQQLLCVVGGAAADVREAIEFSGVQVIENRSFGEGCSSSISAALTAVDSRADVLVLMLGDQPGVRQESVVSLLAGRGKAPMAVCRYADGRGHPLAFGRGMFGGLSEMHGDKAVWKLMDRLGPEVAEVPIDGSIPQDVDTWEDYEAVLAAAGAVTG